MKRYIRITAVILSLSLAFSVLSLGEGAEDEYEAAYRQKVSERYEESFSYSTYYQEITDENGYYYKKWADNIDNKSGATKAYLWCVNQLLDKKLNTQSYIDYLSTILVMMENDFSKSTGAQVAYTAKMSMLDYETGVSLMSFSDLILEENTEWIADVYSILEAEAKIVDITNTHIENDYQLALAAGASVLYEQKLQVLRAIINNTDNKLLKEAAEDVIEISRLQLICTMDQIATEVAPEYINASKSLMSLAFPKDVLPKLSETVANKFAQWLKANVSKKAGNILSSAVSVASKYASTFSAGFSIGAGMMKVFVGDQAELFREMTALDSISDALISAVKDTKEAADKASDLYKYEKISDYVVLTKTLMLVHLRGEYCNVESRSGDKRLNADRYFSFFSGDLQQDYWLVSDILGDFKIYKVADGTDGELSPYLVRAKTADSDSYGYVDVRTGEMVIGAMFKECDDSFGKDGWARVENAEGEEGIINTSGEFAFVFESHDDIASDYYEEEYIVVRDGIEVNIYRGMTHVAKLDIPEENVESVSLRTIQSGGDFDVPERYIPLRVTMTDGTKRIMWFDDSGKFLYDPMEQAYAEYVAMGKNAIEQGTLDYGCLVGDESGYYFFSDMGYVHYIGLDGKLISVSEELDLSGSHSVAWDGDNWYAYVEEGPLSSGGNVIYTNGMTKLDRIQNHGGGRYPKLFANNGVLSTHGMHYRPSGEILYEYGWYLDVWQSFSNGYARVEEGEGPEWHYGDDTFDGYIDIYGNQVLAISEEELYNHSMTLQDGYIVYRENGYCGIKNIEGTVICEPKYTELFYMKG